jgi:hypothetical protein
VYEFQVAALPIKPGDEPTIRAIGYGDTDREVRLRMISALNELGVPSSDSGLIANQTESVWTDFPEHSVTTIVKSG